MITVYVNKLTNAIAIADDKPRHKTIKIYEEKQADLNITKKYFDIQMRMLKRVGYEKLF